MTGNRGPGILVTGGDSNSANRGNTITHNSIHGNGGIGIDLGGEPSDPLIGDGPTLNDAGDGDSGGNELMNYPVIESATLSDTSLIVTGWSGSQTTLEFFEAPGGNQGRTFLASFVEGSADDFDSTVEQLRARSHQWSRFRAPIRRTVFASSSPCLQDSQDSRPEVS